jgi:hypothetical protein
VDFDVFDRVNKFATAAWTATCVRPSKETSTPDKEDETFWYTYTKRESEISGINSEEISTEILDSIFDQEDCLDFDTFDCCWSTEGTTA